MTFEDYFAANYGKLCKKALGFTHNMPDAEDLLHDTFLRCSSRNKSKKIKDFGPYIYIAMKYIYGNVLKRKNKSPVVFDQELFEEAIEREYFKDAETHGKK